MPRIISGIYGGRRLKSPAGRQTRPTSDRVKEALFSAVTARFSLVDCRVLDLFSGSGQVGLEALSRGARQAVLVEKNRRSATVIRENISYLDLGEEVELLVLPAAEALQGLAARGESFDFVFLDPPYKDASRHFDRLSLLLSDLNLLQPEALVVLEHEQDSRPTTAVTNLKLVKRCQYGTAMLSFFLYN